MTTYKAAMILSQDEWEIRCPIGDYRSENAAQRALNSSKARFVENGGVAYIAVSVDGCLDMLLADDHVTVRELSAEAQARLGPPLDVTQPGGIESAVAALTAGDPKYMITDSDLVPSTKSLADFFVRYGDGYKPDHIANEILPCTEIELSAKPGSDD